LYCLALLAKERLLLTRSDLFGFGERGSSFFKVRVEDRAACWTSAPSLPSHMAFRSTPSSHKHPLDVPQHTARCTSWAYACCAHSHTLLASPEVQPRAASHLPPLPPSPTTHSIHTAERCPHDDHAKLRGAFPCHVVLMQGLRLASVSPSPWPAFGPQVRVFVALSLTHVGMSRVHHVQSQT